MSKQLHCIKDNKSNQIIQLLNPESGKMTDFKSIKPDAKIRETPDYWFLNSSGLLLILLKTNGEMLPPRIKTGSSGNIISNGDFDLAQDDDSAGNDPAVSLTIVEERQNRTNHSRLNSETKLEWRKPELNQLELIREFSGCSLQFKTTWTVTETEILIEHELRGHDPTQQKPGVTFEFGITPEPSLRVAELFNCWTPVHHAPFEGLYGQKFFRYPDYIYKPESPLLGLVSLYNKIRKQGFTLAIPVEDLTEAEITVSQRENRMSVKFTDDRGQHTREAVKYRFCLTGHEGCWRPGLKWFRDRYPEYFVPENENFFASEGGYLYSYPAISDDAVKNWVETMNLKWVELLFLPRFGEFAPESSQWRLDMFNGWKNFTGPEAVMDGVTWDLIQEQIARFHKYNVKVYAYFNLFECDTEMAEQEFPENIMTDEHGGKRPAWVYPDGKRRNWCMNPDPKSAWGKHLINQAKRLFEQLPELDGLFVDNILFGLPDFSKHDGFTYIGGKPAYDCHIAHEKMIGAVAEVAKKYNKTLWCNGPNTLRRTRHMGGVMAEGFVAALGKYAYFCLEKPLLLGKNDERSLQYALLYGGNVSVRPSPHFTTAPPEISDADRKLYQAYLPLLKALKRRKMLLCPNALELPYIDGTLTSVHLGDRFLDGNIFELPNGKYAIPLINMVRTHAEDSDGFYHNLPLRIRIPNAAKVKNCGIISVDYPGTREVEFTFSAPDQLNIKIPLHKTASLLIIKTKNDV